MTLWTQLQVPDIYETLEKSRMGLHHKERIKLKSIDLKYRRTKQSTVLRIQVT